MSEDSMDETRSWRSTRRSFLLATGATAGAAIAGRAAASQDDHEYGNVVNVVDAGADPNGEESITPVLRDIVDDDTLLWFPEGRYRMDEQLRFTGFDHFGMAGESGTTLYPAPAHEYNGEARMFKLGTYYGPGQDLTIENLLFDFTADNTGLRAIQAQVSDGLEFRDIVCVGRHDAGTWGPYLVDIVDPSGSGYLERVRAPDGGMYSSNTARDADPTVAAGPTGMLVSPYHEGKLTFRDLRIGPFPDNGLYVSGADGQVTVEGGEFWNSNVANIRLAGDGSEVTGATVVVDYTRPDDVTQRGIRLDEGAGFAVSDVNISLPTPTGQAVTVTSNVESARIEDSQISVGDDVYDGISISEGAGPVEVRHSDIQIAEGGQAIFIGQGDNGAKLEAVTVTGQAAGAYGGRCAVRCERDGTVVDSVVIDQPGEDYRRAIGIHANDCAIQGGEFRATHHPIISSGESIEIHDVTARSYENHEAIKLLGASAHVDISHSVLYEGILDQGTEDLDTWDNQYPDG